MSKKNKSKIKSKIQDKRKKVTSRRKFKYSKAKSTKQNTNQELVNNYEYHNLDTINKVDNNEGILIDEDMPSIDELNKYNQIMSIKEYKQYFPYVNNTQKSLNQWVFEQIEYGESDITLSFKRGTSVKDKNLAWIVLSMYKTTEKFAMND